jgi:hypothetical protein
MASANEGSSNLIGANGKNSISPPGSSITPDHIRRAVEAIVQMVKLDIGAMAGDESVMRGSDIRRRQRSKPLRSS